MVVVVVMVASEKNKNINWPFISWNRKQNQNVQKIDAWNIMIIMNNLICGGGG